MCIDWLLNQVVSKTKFRKEKPSILENTILILKKNNEYQLSKSCTRHNINWTNRKLPNWEETYTVFRQHPNYSKQLSIVLKLWVNRKHVNRMFKKSTWEHWDGQQTNEDLFGNITICVKKKRKGEVSSNYIHQIDRKKCSWKYQVSGQRKQELDELRYFSVPLHPLQPTMATIRNGNTDTWLLVYSHDHLRKSIAQRTKAETEKCQIVLYCMSSS